MADMFATLWQWFLNLVLSVVAWLADLFWTAWHWLMNQIRELADQVIAFMRALLPQSWVDYLNQTPWESFYGYFDLVDWFVPVYAGLGIFATALTICAVIRTGRWILGLIPTIEG